MKKLLLFALLLTHFSVWANDSISIQGYWLNEKEEIVVEIYILNDELRGRIVWMADELDENNQLRRDVMNRKPQLRSRTLMGLDIFYGFQNKKGTWKQGRVYNYRNGHKYNAKLKIDEHGDLQWTGYYGVWMFLSRTKKWVRVIDKQKYGLE